MDNKTSKPQAFEPDPAKKATFFHVLTLLLYHELLASFWRMQFTTYGQA